jgi:hypothetical protein
MPRRISTLLASALFAIGIALVIWAHQGGSPIPNAETGQTVEIAQGHFSSPLYVTPLRADLNIAGIVALLIGVALAAFPVPARRRKGK